MSVAITAQPPVAASSPPTASPEAAQGLGSGTGATSEQGLVDSFAKTRLDVANGNLAEATNSMASSGEMVAKLREFVEKSHRADASLKAIRDKRRAAAIEAETDLASLDTLGSLGKFGSPAQFNPLGESGSIGRFASLDQFGSSGLPPGPASASLGPGPGLEGKSRPLAMLDKITNDSMDSAIHNMWTQVVGHATKSLTESVMTLLKGQ
jgi:hypothetical protein